MRPLKSAWAEPSLPPLEAVMMLSATGLSQLAVQYRFRQGGRSIPVQNIANTPKRFIAFRHNTYELSEHSYRLPP
jgi:hypothetical protein